MKIYRVDVRNLSPEEKEAFHNQLDMLAFMTTFVYEGNVLSAIDVCWDRKDDFLTSPIFPAGRSCALLGG